MEQKERGLVPGPRRPLLGDTTENAHPGHALRFLPANASETRTLRTNRNQSWLNPIHGLHLTAAFRRLWDLKYGGGWKSMGGGGAHHDSSPVWVRKSQRHQHV